MADQKQKVSKQANGPSLYEQVGGHAAVQAVVDRLYERLPDDPVVGPFFANSDIDWLKDQQVRFFSQALGGPAKYAGADMKKAHADLQIGPGDFDIVGQHLDDVLRELSVPIAIHQQIMGLVGSLKSEIVDPAISAKAAAA